MKPYFHPGPKRLYAAAKLAGFPDSTLLTVVQIAYAESSGNAWEVSANPDGTRDHGAWQINDVHRDILAIGDRYNYCDNARMAFVVWSRAKQRFTDWAAYNSGEYNTSARIKLAKQGASDFAADHRELYIVASTFLDPPGS